MQSSGNMSVECVPLQTPHSKTGVCRGIPVFLFLLQNSDCGYSLEPPRRGGSNAEAVLMCIHNLCFEQNKKKYQKISNEIFQYLSRLMGKPTICIGENKGADQLRGSAFVFAIRIVQFLFYLTPKFQASSMLL